MSDVIDEAIIVKRKLSSHETVKEYRRLKELYEKDEELKRMRKEIARLSSEGKKAEAENLRKIYDAHPLVNNYQEARKELIKLLLVLDNILQ